MVINERRNVDIVNIDIGSEMLILYSTILTIAACQIFFVILSTFCERGSGTTFQNSIECTGSLSLSSLYKCLLLKHIRGDRMNEEFTDICILVLGKVLRLGNKLKTMNYTALSVSSNEKFT